jgi:hypothetical protein
MSVARGCNLDSQQMWQRALRRPPRRRRVCGSIPLLSPLLTLISRLPGVNVPFFPEACTTITSRCRLCHESSTKPRHVESIRPISGRSALPNQLEIDPPLLLGERDLGDMVNGDRPKQVAVSLNRPIQISDKSGMKGPGGIERAERGMPNANMRWLLRTVGQSPLDLIVASIPSSSDDARRGNFNPLPFPHSITQHSCCITSRITESSCLLYPGATQMSICTPMVFRSGVSLILPHVHHISGFRH